MVFEACKSLEFNNISKKDEIDNLGSNDNVVKIEIYTTCCDIEHRQNIRIYSWQMLSKLSLLFYD